jgi:hypothetical protein
MYPLSASRLLLGGPHAEVLAGYEQH